MFLISDFPTFLQEGEKSCHINFQLEGMCDSSWTAMWG